MNASDDHSRHPVCLQSAHRPQRGFAPAVVALDPVVRAPSSAVERGGEQFIDGMPQRVAQVGHHLAGLPVGAERGNKERAGAPMSRRTETHTSITWPPWSTPR